MKRKTFSELFLIFFLASFFYTNISAQNFLISIKLGIPSNVGNTFYSEWDGIINAGIKYSNLRKRNLYLNVYFNYDRLNYPLYDWNSKQNLYKFGLGLQYKVMISNTANLYPQFGVGYAYQNINNETYNSSIDNSGLNLLSEIELLFQVMDNLNAGLSLRYDYIWLGLPEYAGDSTYNRRIHTITPTVQLLIEL